ncbi:MAG: hypothetical protein NTV22_07830, partial [bacterium]|nr:hypothetical protein [bacterium]
CKYVEHAAGAPVLPCVEFYVVMPKGAQYKTCRVQASAESYRGTYKVFTRTAASGIPSARRFPPKVIEFVGHRNVRGYRVFAFRAYPVSCQPADGSVARVLQTKIAIDFVQPAAPAKYAPASPAVVTALKKVVINPDDIETLTQAEETNEALAAGAIYGAHTLATRDVFATGIAPRATARDGAGDDFFSMLEDNVYINEENDIVYAPIRF